MEITVIGKKGCTKCSKMAIILESKGHKPNLVYPEKSGIIDGIQIDLVDGMHYPIYIINDRLVDNFKDLNQILTTPSPRAEEP
jgi:hypothetical protein